MNKINVSDVLCFSKYFILMEYIFLKFLNVCLNSTNSILKSKHQIKKFFYKNKVDLLNIFKLIFILKLEIAIVWLAHKKYSTILNLFEIKS